MEESNSNLDQGVAARESVDTFVTDMRNMARIVPIRDEEQLRFAIVKGLHVLQSAATTLDGVIKAARTE